MKLKDLKNRKDYKDALKAIRTQAYQDAFKLLLSIYKTLPTDGQDNQVCRIFLKIDMAKVCSRSSVLDISEQLAADTNSRETPFSLAAYSRLKNEIEDMLVNSALSKDNVEKLQNKLTAVKQDLSDNLIRKAEDKIIQQSVHDKSSVERSLQEIEDFYRYYQSYLVSSHEKYLLKVLVSISENLSNNLFRRETKQLKLGTLRFIISLLSRAKVLTSEGALVKSAEICFEKWSAYQQFILLTDDSNKKRLACQLILDEFKDVFGEPVVENCPHYYARATQYAYAISYAHSALTELEKLSQDADQKADCQQKAAGLKAEFVKLSESGAIHILELPASHHNGMLIAQSQLAPLKERERLEEGSYEDQDSASEEEKEVAEEKNADMNESDSDAELDAHFRAFQQVMMRHRAEEKAVVSTSSSSLLLTTSSSPTALPFSSSFRLSSVTTTTIVTSAPARTIKEDNNKRRKI